MDACWTFVSSLHLLFELKKAHVGQAGLACITPGRDLRYACTATKRKANELLYA
jgi:hypothetical protein